jgi:hypothetical protein
MVGKRCCSALSSRSTSWARSRLMSRWVKDAWAARRTREPSSSRMLDFTCLAMNRDTSSGRRTPLRLGLLAKNRGLGLQVRRLDVRDEAPFESRAEALLQRGDLAGDAVRADHDLLGGVVQIVEGVEKLLLRPLLSRDELDVVDQEQVQAAVPIAELDGGVEADGVDEIVGELLGRHVGDPDARIALPRVMTDGVEQVGLAEAHAAVDEQGIVRLRELLPDRHAGRVRELVARPDHERVEGVFRIELGAGVAGTARGAALGLLFLPWDSRGIVLLGQDQPDLDLVEHQVFERRPQQAQIMLLEPFLEKTIRKQDLDAVLLDRPQRQRTEPGLEALPADPVPDHRQRFFPDFAYVRRRYPLHIPPSAQLIHSPSNRLTLRKPEIGFARHARNPHPEPPGGYPQVSPQMWITGTSIVLCVWRNCPQIRGAFENWKCSEHFENTGFPALCQNWETPFSAGVARLSRAFFKKIGWPVEPAGQPLSSRYPPPHAAGKRAAQPSDGAERRPAGADAPLPSLAGPVPCPRRTSPGLSSRTAAPRHFP